MIKSEYVKKTERIKFQVYEGIRDLGYNAEYEELFVLLKLADSKESIGEKHENVES